VVAIFDQPQDLAEHTLLGGAIVQEPTDPSGGRVRTGR